MTSRNELLNLLEDLQVVYEKLDDENKDRLEEAIQMVLTKFKDRV